LFIPCDRLSWQPVSFLLHVKYTLSYRIVRVGDAMMDDVGDVTNVKYDVTLPRMTSMAAAVRLEMAVAERE